VGPKGSLGDGAAVRSIDEPYVSLAHAGAGRRQRVASPRQLLVPEPSASAGPAAAGAGRLEISLGAARIAMRALMRRR
jgi:hypothetical protein